ncbi:MAG TPA: hypothetical protein VHS53_09720, partial [Mucilaginibacter sp.]|nr:hypothetical protein [Mucilaginibacter sp.]
MTLCLGIILPARAQDSTKKEEKLPSAVVKPQTAKPAAAHHIRKSIPPVIPNAANVSQNTDSAQAAFKLQMDPAQLNDKSLNGQYQYLLSKTLRYQQPLLAALWKNAMDTLSASRNQVKDAQAKLAAKAQLADSLKKTTKTEQQSLDNSNQKADTISLFGIDMSKSGYNLLMFGLVIVLGIALAIVIATTAKHRHEAKYRTQLYEEIEEDFKTFKAKA